MAPVKAGEGERAKLSRSAVVDHALALADNDGVNALTIRRLATEVGVTPMALYWHFRSKEELMAGLADRIWDEIRTDVDPAADWPAQLRAMLESLIDVLRSHSSASTLLMGSEKLGPSHWQATEKTLEILRTAGFDPEHASEIARSALWTGLTLVMSEPGFNDAGLTEPERAEIQRRKQIELASLPPDRYPRLVEAAVPMTSCGDGPDFHYKFGIDLFIAGVRALAPPER
ncbi:MAG TPA: TetR/AcrR family transcriptional regulator C-terminal domain-containing protein [Streptosporangiaceae bacterium]|nr:TetR/AcrR family transcriptional regulator C-terminal domain-containing protein [Streptosporangiaceae bacterium]